MSRPLTRAEKHYNSVNQAQTKAEIKHLEFLFGLVASDEDLAEYAELTTVYKAEKVDTILSNIIRIVFFPITILGFIMDAVGAKGSFSITHPNGRR